MNIENVSVNRRNILRGAVAAAVLIPFSTTLASCATGGGGGGGGGPKGEVTADNPFGLATDSKIDSVIFDGGYGTDYVEYAAKILEKQHDGVTAKVSASTKISQELQPRFVGGNPPDLVDNSGADSIGFSTIMDQIEDLTDVIDAKNLEGDTIRDTLYAGALDPGTFGDKFAAVNYVMTIYGVWYSASLFEEKGWEVPTTWADLKDLGAKAKEDGKYLFCWGKEAATYYQTMSIGAAIKQGGDEVRLALENLEEGCWSKQAIQDVFTAFKEIIDAGYMKPGGAGTQFTAAQAQWSNDQAAILYPSGSWIENEMKDQTKEGFEMKGFPTPALDENAKMPPEAVRATAGEPFIVPSQANNVAGGKELLRVMLSKDAATNFAKTKLAPTVVKGLVPEDGFGSTALVSQTDMLDAAGENIYNWKFVDLYGMNSDQLTLWNQFLAGKMSVADLTAGLQEITDRVRNDDSIDKVEVK
ncbi:N-acetylglucosamine/diacetylchitobiose ABC transporter substrate-binding protein [Paramicrobacterium agarici]|uniref:Carbohydrate ABC transporter substrate-binding protein (CUT1 family) n=1 Tax=Paramicrobacterium agarici TaxID=630514 RepID=A0A2A9DRV7_9MICO|nr:N-acetylglucosamine/diacetylchitobiose ABC transporter substrate-binding protein [Microbacterium agarici]PFG29121.1 carbohydrate ABC transporter substrate-binding protein (CUT1 family) [Microbacterium agarici]